MLAGLHGAVAVSLGAYAAHGMAARYDVVAIAWVDTGSRYQLIHAAALAAVAFLAGAAPAGWARRWLALAGTGFALGALLFAGALYGLAFTGLRSFGAVAPFGGTALILGWALLIPAGAAWRGGGNG